MAKRLLGKEVNEALVAALQAAPPLCGRRASSPPWASSVWARIPLTCPMKRALPSGLRKWASL